MNIENLEKILENEPSYRLKQAKAAIFKDLIDDWGLAKNLPQELRNKLKKNYPLEIEAGIFPSKDGTIKIHLALRDGLKIESVLLSHEGGRNTVCVSSQAGCPLGCQFCLTGQMGFKRNLDYSEIAEQVLFFARLFKKPFDAAPAFSEATAGRQGKITNVVFMGMGEPFLNHDNVLRAIRVLNDKDGFNLGARHFSISTVGITEGIEKLAQENLQVNLAISLHAADDGLREKIMPINKKYPIKKIMAAAGDYIKKTKRRVMFEYIMIQDVNDSDEQAKNLAKLLSNMPLSFVNLISYNFTPLENSSLTGPTGIFKPSLPERIKIFKEILEKNGISATQRYRFGQDIRAACGQLGVC